MAFSFSSSSPHLPTSTVTVNYTLDAAFLRDPFRDRKGFWAHVHPTSLLICVARHTALQGLQLVADKDAPPFPEDPAAAGELVLRRVWKPVATELAGATVSRILESVAISVVHEGDPVAGARYVRKAHVAAGEAYSAALAERRGAGGGGRRGSRGGSGGSALGARAETAVHVAFHVIPYPALISNLSMLIVEEVDVLASWAYRVRRRQRVQRVLWDPAASSSSKRAASAELAELDSSKGPGVVPVQELVLNVVKAGAGVLLEVVVGGVGTLVWPGFGTTVGSLLGGMAAWLAI
jgi:hypothetical protein